ncbi:MAG: hypothetical protein FWC60_10355 [Firmicutes bacterium]|nr:hypothetical protein [Bacillota bacterium]
MDSKWKTRIIAGALGLSVLVPAAAFAASAGSSSTAATGSASQYAAHQRFGGRMGQSSMDNIMTIVKQYAPDTQSQWQNAIDQHNQLMTELQAKMPQKPQLTDAQKQQLQDIRTQLKNGTITQDQADTQLQSLGLPGKWGAHMNRQANPNDNNTKTQRPQLTDAQKQQLQDIRTQLKNGTITQDQADAQLKSLGLPGNWGAHMNRQANTNDNDTNTPRPQLTDAQKQQLQDIMAKVKDGTLTKEQAQTQLQSLGLPERGKMGFGGPNNSMQQLNQAVAAGDTSTIQNLLAQQLQQLTKMNQDLAAKLAQS